MDFNGIFANSFLIMLLRLLTVFLLSFVVENIVKNKHYF